MSQVKRHPLNSLRRLFYGLSCIIIVTTYHTVHSQSTSQPITIDGIFLYAPFGLTKTGPYKFGASNAQTVSISSVNLSNSAMMRYLLQTLEVDGFVNIGFNSGYRNGKEQLIASFVGYGPNSTFLSLVSVIEARRKFYSIISTVDKRHFVNEDKALEKAYDNLDHLWKQLSNLN